jgi:S-adenosylmethionine:tRNA ribosyltransferase-isomerase
VTLSDFQFDLPPELIAQVPAERRDRARLLVLDRSSGMLAHTHVHALAEHLRPGDLLVVNDTKVIPARLFGRIASGGAVELLLIRPLTSALSQGDCRFSPDVGAVRESPEAAVLVRRAFSGGSRTAPTPQMSQSEKIDSPQGAREKACWLSLGKPAKRLRPGTQVTLPENVRATITAVHGNGHYTIAFEDAAAAQTLIDRHGEIPLPPYIRRPDGPLPLDLTRYQTVFADVPGAIAAPTAGLHFTDELLAAVQRKGIEIARLTLHVGPGTFLPVRSEDLSKHVMAAEWCDIPAATTERIRAVKAAGGRVVAVGTTTTRALESAAAERDVVASGPRWADCFILPGYQFRVVDALFTNFHLPGSTLLLLVSAFGGHERILSTYAEAIRRGYRFYSYGDAMLIQ